MRGDKTGLTDEASSSTPEMISKHICCRYGPGGLTEGFQPCLTANSQDHKTYPCLLELGSLPVSYLAERLVYAAFFAHWNASGLFSMVTNISFTVRGRATASPAAELPDDKILFTKYGQEILVCWAKYTR